MCGICGIINFNHSRNSIPLSKPIKKMAKRMERRGPDDEGFILFDSSKENDTGSLFFGDATSSKTKNLYKNRLEDHINNADSKIDVNIAFGHRRLKIIDLSPNAFQPMNDTSKRYSLIFNGEIYNYKEIREELVNKGYKFHSNSDSEVLLNSFIHWKEKCLSKFNGMFAFAIYDTVEKKIFIARDRIGIKPLFYTISNSNLIFASDIKTIIASGLYKPEVDEDGLWTNISLSISSGSNTLFKGVKPFPQGHYCYIDITSEILNKDLKFEQYWKIPTGQEDDSITEKRALETIDELLHQSIKYRLISDVEIGSFMSGGIDSSTVTAIAAKLNPGIKAFTLGFSDGIEDEVELAKSNAKRIDITHKIKRVSANDLIVDLNDMLLCFEEPYPSLAPGFILAKFAKQESAVRVILNGLGGDEQFAGYHFYNNYYNFEKYRKKTAPFLKYLPDFNNRKLKVIKTASQIGSIGEYYTYVRSMFKDFEAKQIFNKEKMSIKNSWDILKNTSQLYSNQNSNPLQFSSPLDELSYWDLFWYIGKHQVYRDDQFLMHFSIEGRFPLLDHNLIEYTAKIPWGLKIKNSTDKYLFKKYAEKFVPMDNIYSPKRGFNIPIGKLLDGTLKEFAKDNLTDLKKRDSFDPNYIDRIINDNIKNDKMWHLVMMEMWYKEFIDQTS